MTEDAARLAGRTRAVPGLWQFRRRQPVLVSDLSERRPVPDPQRERGQRKAAGPEAALRRADHRLLSRPGRPAAGQPAGRKQPAVHHLRSALPPPGSRRRRIRPAQMGGKRRPDGPPPVPNEPPLETAGMERHDFPPDPADHLHRPGHLPGPVRRLCKHRAPVQKCGD